VDLLLFLDAEHPAFFHRIMGGCRSLSNSDPVASIKDCRPYAPLERRQDVLDRELVRRR
jgi:hypothetical protein